MKLEVQLFSQLEGFSLEAELALETTRLVFFGPSGAGKSLCLRFLAGVSRPDRGRIVLDDEVLLDTQNQVEVPAQQRGIGYLPQQSALFPHLTVRDNLFFGIRRSLPTEDQDFLLDLSQTLGIGTLLDRHPHQISGGQAQRVALLRALAPKPRLLLLDEPFSALDGPLRRRLREEILEIQDRTGVAMILVTHDLDEARLLAQDLAVIRRGKVLQSGPVEEVLDHPAEVCVARLTGIRNLFSGVVGETAAGGRCLRAGGLVLPCSCRRWQVGERVTLALRAEQLRLHSSLPESPDPETTQVPVRLTEQQVLRHHHRVTVIPREAESPEIEVLVPLWAVRETSLDPGREAFLEVHKRAIHVLKGADPRDSGASEADLIPPLCQPGHGTPD